MTKQRLRVQLLAGMFSLIAVVLVVPLVLSHTLLEPFYQYQKEQELLDLGGKLLKLSPRASDVGRQMDSLDPEHRFHISIADRRQQVLHDHALADDQPERPRPPDPNRPPPEDPPPHVFIPGQEIAALSPGDLATMVHRDPNTDAVSILAYGRFTTGESLVVSVPRSEIHGAATTASVFLLLCGAAALVPAAALAFWLARRFTQPLRELSRLSGELERQALLDGLRREFVSNASHELKTPITLIQGYAEGLVEGVAGDEERRRQYLEVIIDESRKLDLHVRELLELSQWEGSGRLLDYSVVDVPALVRREVARFQSRFDEGGIECRLELGVESMTADPGGVARVLDNFLTNALAHGASPGLVTVRVEQRAGVRFEVFNAGPPIPDPLRERIWQSYFKLDKSRSRQFGGTGLGLSIVKGIMDRHGGRYGCENRPAGELTAGVAFWVEFPNSPPESSATALSPNP